MRPLLILAMLSLAAPAVAVPPAGGPKGPPAAGAAAYRGRFAADPRLSPVDVAALPPASHRVVRNEIFARYGRAFTSADLRAHFQGQPWYREDPSYSDARLSANDRANAALIQSFEAPGVDPVPRGDFSGPRHLSFVDARTVLIGIGGDYDFVTAERRWATFGRWLVTWDGPERWDPTAAGIEDATLWELDLEAGTARELGPIPTGARRG
jgi:hypothetical protein